MIEDYAKQPHIFYSIAPLSWAPFIPSSGTTGPTMAGYNMLEKERKIGKKEMSFIKTLWRVRKI